jgi:DNA-binding response OmpR family regulator
MRSILVLEHDILSQRRTIDGLIAKKRSVVLLRSPELVQELISRCPDLFNLVLLNATVVGAVGLCTELRRKGFRDWIVFFDGATGEDDFVDALEAGADGFLPRGCSIREAANRLFIPLREVHSHNFIHLGQSTQRIQRHRQPGYSRTWVMAD